MKRFLIFACVIAWSDANAQQYGTQLKESCYRELVRVCVYTDALPEPTAMRKMFERCKPHLDKTPGVPITYPEMVQECVNAYLKWR